MFGYTQYQPYGLSQAKQPCPTPMICLLQAIQHR